MAEAKSARLKDKIASLREQMRKVKALKVAVHAAPDKQISLTDPDARSMATSGKDTGRWSATMCRPWSMRGITGSSRTRSPISATIESQLATMAKEAQAATGGRDLTAIADRGCFKGEEIVACEAAGVTPIVPKPLTSGAKADGRFGRQDFVCDPGEDAYRRPAGETLTWRCSNVEEGFKAALLLDDEMRRLRAEIEVHAFQGAARKTWEHEAVLDAMQERLDRAPTTMRIRRQTAEHPFGTIKAWMGATHFRLRTLEKVRTEMSLHVLAYNLKRMIAILGAQPMIQAMRAA
ncbi:MAG TPA: transposase [Roseiarcus sp.]|nr:transposase [Roseiarcus sp.]